MPCAIGPFGEQREGFLGARLPVAAMDEQQRRRFFGRLEEIDPVALARAISEVEMAGMPRAHFGGTPVPAGDDVGASGHRDAVVEAEVELLLAHGAPVRRIERRRHRKISKSGRQRMRFHFAGKCSTATTQSAATKRNDGRCDKWPIRDWCGRPHAPSSINSIPAKSRRSICSTCWSSGSPRSTARSTPCRRCASIAPAPMPRP